MTPQSFVIEFIVTGALLFSTVTAGSYPRGIVNRKSESGTVSKYTFNLCRAKPASIHREPLPT